MTSTPPPSYRISRGRPPPFRSNPPSELAQNKGNTNGLPYPLGVRIRCYRWDDRQVAQFSPQGRTAPSKPPSGSKDQILKQTGGASSERSEDDPMTEVTGSPVTRNAM